MFPGHHCLLFSRAIGIVRVRFFGIQFMLIVLFRRYVCVIAASDVFFCVVLFGLSLHVNCIRLRELFTNYGILIMWVGYIVVDLLTFCSIFGYIKNVQVHFMIFIRELIWSVTTSVITLSIVPYTVCIFQYLNSQYKTDIWTILLIAGTGDWWSASATEVHQ
jgi:hypothetical protein